VVVPSSIALLLESEDVRRHRRAIALARAGVLTLLLFAFPAMTTSRS
jgi:hypothetical protein